MIDLDIWSAWVMRLLVFAGVFYVAYAAGFQAGQDSAVPVAEYCVEVLERAVEQLTSVAESLR